jgi:hypothetical protein
VDEGLARGVDFLRRRQEPSGEFAIELWREDEGPGSSVRDHAVMVTGCVLYALRFIDAATVGDITSAAVRFLIGEMRPPGVWSYWTAASGKRIEPDLDDTALLSFVLRRHHPHIALGSNVEAILAARNRDGLFHTWLRPPDRRNDVDTVVNANVVLHLGERRETGAACDHLRACVLSGREAGSYWYYVDDSSLHYAISRALWHGVRALDDLRGPLVEKALARQRRDGSFGDELCTAWTLSTLLNAGSDDRDAISDAVGSLLARQRADGGWASVAAFAGPEPPGPRTFRWGSQELTAAACVEALARVRAHPATGTVESQRGLM